MRGAGPEAEAEIITGNPSTASDSTRDLGHGETPTCTYFSVPVLLTCVVQPENELLAPTIVAGPELTRHGTAATPEVMALLST